MLVYDFMNKSFTVFKLPWRMASLFRYNFIVLSPFSAGVCVFVFVCVCGGGGNFCKKDAWKKNMREVFAWGH